MTSIIRNASVYRRESHGNILRSQSIYCLGELLDNYVTAKTTMHELPVVRERNDPRVSVAVRNTKNRKKGAKFSIPLCYFAGNILRAEERQFHAIIDATKARITRAKYKFRGITKERGREGGETRFCGYFTISRTNP